MLDLDLSLASSGTSYYVLVQYSNEDMEFGLDLDAIKHIKDNSQKIFEFIKESARKVNVSGIKVIVSGVVIGILPISSFMTLCTRADRYSVGYLYSGTDSQQIEYVGRTNGALNTVSPSYFDIQSDGSLKLNYLSQELITSMHEQGIKVVPFLSNHWNRDAGINALNNLDQLSTEIAKYVEEYDLDGVNVDIENVTEKQRNQYTELVRLLREKIPTIKEVSVAVAANPYDWQTGWHGSYDYTALANFADHLFIMTYDEHYEGGEAGPVASFSFVENSLKYALSKTSSGKIVVGLPLYGRVWGLDSDRIKGKGIKLSTIKDIIKNCDAEVSYDEESRSMMAEFEIKEGDPEYVVGGDFVLLPGRYVVWYDDEESYQEKLSLVSKYDLKGAGTWSVGQEDVSIWNNYGDWLNLESNETIGNYNVESSVEKVKTKHYAKKYQEKNSENASKKIVKQTPENEDISGDNTVYVVKRGDSLWKIANQYMGAGELYPLIKSLNDLSSDTITVGMKLRIPLERHSYTVKPGDSLWNIAKQFLGSGSLYPVIKKLNNLTGDIIYPGQILTLYDVN